MPWRIVHLVEGHLGLTPLWGQFTTEELSHYDQTALGAISRGQHPLMHNIYDCSGLDSLPPLIEMSKLQVGQHPRVGWIIFVGIRSDLLKFILSMTTQMFGHRLRFMKSHTEALQFLQQVDSTLPKLDNFDIPAIVKQLHAGEIPPGVTYIGP